MNKPTDENATTQQLEDNTGATPETGADDPLDLTAADLLGMTAEPTEDEEPKTDAEEEESQPEPEEGEDGQEDDEPAESEEDESEPDVPSLDSAIEAALTDKPELIQRWREQWKGLQKREAKQAEWQEGIDSVFSDPDYAREAVPVFISRIAEHHGMTLEELIGGNRSDELTVPDPDAFDNYTDEIIATRQYLETKQERELRALRDELDALKAHQAQTSQKAERDKALDQALGQVQRVFDKEHQGFKVTRKMLAEAVEQFPHLEPVKAVKAAQVDALVAHRGKVVANAHKVDVSPMLKGQTGKGHALPDDPTEIKAAHILALRE